MVELQVVALAVAGSSPVVHPKPPKTTADRGREMMMRPAAAPAVVLSAVNAVRVWRNW
jgi:hypothetical protein